MKNTNALIFLVGLPGSGKSTLGKKLAKQLGFTFFDLDQLIEEKENATITEIFEKKGEEFFRRTESEVLIQITPKNKIIATGGGTPAYNKNIDFMLQHGIVIWLDADVNLIAQRVFNAKSTRPMFKNLHLTQVQEKLQQLFIEREMYYSQAHIKISIKSLNAQKIEILANQIKTQLK